MADTEEGALMRARIVASRKWEPKVSLCEAAQVEVNRHQEAEAILSAALEVARVAYELAVQALREEHETSRAKMEKFHPELKEREFLISEDHKSYQLSKPNPPHGQPGHVCEVRVVELGEGGEVSGVDALAAMLASGRYRGSVH